MSSLDQPLTLEFDDLTPEATWRLANGQLRFLADSHSDLTALEWPAAQAEYARSMRVRVTPLHGDELVPLANRYYPGYQETILGSEALILSKRIAAPFRGPEERAVLWSFECQAEGDSVFRMDVDIDWGEPLTQRVVDGLLVAQRNPTAGQGIYRQSNAESTRVFGNPHSPPESLELDDGAGTAHLVYYVLVNGIVDVSLLLTVSDVGEQVAWSAFLGLRESDRVLEGSRRAWDAARKTGRIWTPDTRVNAAIDAGKRETLQHVVQLHTGLAPADRSIVHAPALIDGLDVLDLTASRNLLAHLRRLAERSTGRPPLLIPAQSREPLIDPGRAIARTIGAYLIALQRHLSRHWDATLLEAHYEAVGLCSEVLMRARSKDLAQLSVPELTALGMALRAAQALATLRRDGANTVRWENEACDIERAAEAAGGVRAVESPLDWENLAGWRTPTNRPWQFDDPWAGIRLAAQAVWQGAGVTIDARGVSVRPTFPAQWSWWALEGLATPHGPLSLVWDGARLHSTLPLRGPLPVLVHNRIRALRTDEDDFDLTFDFSGEHEPVDLFHPRFADPAY